MKSKILDIKYKKEWESKFGILHQYAIKVIINDEPHWAVYNSKSKDQKKFIVGEVAEFTEIEKHYNGKKYYQIKPIVGNYASNFSRQLKKEQSRYSGFAMSYAKDLVVAEKIPPEKMFIVADKMLKWMVEADKNLENG